MNTQPLVSIIIPTYNRAHLIGETLDSVEAQTYLNWECIIVDDGSSDNTDEVIGEYVQTDSRFKYYHRLEDYAKGANSCRHIGFLKSNGDYINWFDSDDLMLVNHIETKMKKMMSGDYDFVCCEMARFKFNNQKNLIYLNYDYSRGKEIINQFIGNLTLSTPGPLWSKSFLNKNKLYYKPNIKEKKDSVLNDWTFGLDALMVTNNFSFIKKPLVLYRSHDNSIYADRLNSNPVKFLDEFEIRKSYYNKILKHLGSNNQVEKYYLIRNLKILRNLLIKRSKTLHVFVEILKSNHLNFFKKISLSFFYMTFILFHKGLTNLKYD
jgi:glycosyltransferase involved in cell wall biosynthesis